MATKKPNQPRAANGKFAKKQPRPINTLKPNEAIQVNNDAERNGILKLMEAEGWEWNDGSRAICDFNYSNYPYCLDYGLNGEGKLCISWLSVGYYKDHKGNTILPASDFLPTEPKLEQTTESKPTEQQIDWTKPQPFPEGYEIQKECRAVKVAEKQPDWIKIGATGTIIPDGTDVPKFKCDNTEHYPIGYGENGNGVYESIYLLAPLDPTDHPLHPEFKGAKDGVSDGVNDGESDGEKPTQPIDYKSLFHQAQSKVDELQAKVEDLDVIYDFDRAQAKKHREILRSKMIDYAKTWPSSHSAQLLGELILDGLI